MENGKTMGKTIGKAWENCDFLRHMDTPNHGFSPSQIYPNSWMVEKVEDSPTNMDDDWGYPHFRNPPYNHIVAFHG